MKTYIWWKQLPILTQAQVSGFSMSALSYCTYVSPEILFDYSESARPTHLILHNSMMKAMASEIIIH